MDIKDLQEIDIKWIGWRNAFKLSQELVSLVTEFSNNILIDQKVYARLVFNRVYKSMQCF